MLDVCCHIVFVLLYYVSVMLIVFSACHAAEPTCLLNCSINKKPRMRQKHNVCIEKQRSHG